MIISMKKGCPQSEIQKMEAFIKSKGLQVHLSKGENYTILGLVGDTTAIDPNQILAHQWVDEVRRISAPYKKANRLFHPEDTIVDVAGVKVGGKEKIVVIGGPCSIETHDNTISIEGHTDNVPQNTAQYPDNMVLSMYRAYSVYTYFVDTKGFNVNSISSTGRGEAVPVASNATAEGRAQNRRVEIKIYNMLNS